MAERFPARDSLPDHGPLSQHGAGPDGLPVPARHRVLVEGTVRAVRIQPVQAVPRYQAELEVFSSRRTVVSAQARAARGSFAAPTSAIGMDTPEDAAPDGGPLPEGGRVRLVWHGQRSVPGVGAGTLLRCSGMLAGDSSGPVIYNPRYEIVSAPFRP